MEWAGRLTEAVVHWVCRVEARSPLQDGKPWHTVNG